MLFSKASCPRVTGAVCGCEGAISKAESVFGNHGESRAVVTNSVCVLFEKRAIDLQTAVNALSQKAASNQQNLPHWVAISDPGFLALVMEYFRVSNQIR